MYIQVHQLHLSLLTKVSYPTAITWTCKSQLKINSNKNTHEDTQYRHFCDSRIVVTIILNKKNFQTNRGNKTKVNKQITNNKNRRSKYMFYTGF